MSFFTKFQKSIQKRVNLLLYGNIDFGFFGVEHNVLGFFQPNINTPNIITTPPHTHNYPHPRFFAIFRKVLNKMPPKKRAF